MPDIKKDFEIILHQADQICKNMVVKANLVLEPFTPLELIILTLAGVIVLRYVFDKLAYVRKEGVVTLAFRFVTKLPFVSGKIAEKSKDCYEEYA